MGTSLQAAAMGLAEVMVLYDQYFVPEYQRVYGWGELEISRLFSDLERAMRPNAPGFYLGPIYLAAGKGERRAQIADGQQRLLTATIAYAAARDLAENTVVADRLHALVATPGDAGFRVVPRERDAGFFRQWVQERGATLVPFASADAAAGDGMAGEDPELELSESQANIIANRDAIVQMLRTLGEEGRNRLFDFLAHRTDIVVITASQLEEARNAYASTQTRGLRQAETDKLKAELIGDCPIDVRARLALQWDDCEAILGKEDLTELLQHMIVVRSAKKPSHAIEVDLFRAFNLPRDVDAFIGSELLPSARAFRRMCEISPGTARATRRIGGYFVALRRTTHTAWKAPALLALREYEGDPGTLEAVLRGLERLSVSLMIRGTDPNVMLDRYIAVIQAMRAGPAAALAALDLSDKERVETRKGLHDTRFGMRDRYRMPLLLKLNDLVAKEVQDIDPKSVSCEHVLPRNVPRRSPWREVFRSAQSGHFEGRRFVHMLGNLTVLRHDENQAADTHPFSHKKAIFKRSKIALANEAAKAKAWTPEYVRGRTDRLAKLLEDYWRF